MTQSELRIYINTAAAEAMKDLRRMRDEIARLEAATKSMRASARSDGANTFVNTRDIENTRRLNTELNTNSARSRDAANSSRDLARAKELASIANQKLSASEQIATTKMEQGTASATAMAAAYGRVATAAGAASAAQTRLASTSASMGNFVAAGSARANAAELLQVQRRYVDLGRQMGVAAAKGDEFGHRTKRSLFDTLAAVNDNESAMRKWGSQIQWTGRQMLSNLTIPLGLIAGMSGKVWFDQTAAMTGVAKVYGDLSMAAGVADAELDALDKKFTELSNVFGINKEEVIGVAEGWAAAGASGVELAKGTNMTMQAMVLGGLEAQEATDALIATQAQYGISVDGMSRVLAQFNLVENETGVKMGGLIKAFSRTAGVARTAGMDTAHLAAMVAALNPAAGTAAEAGNGLKTIMTRLSKQTKDTTDVLSMMGVNMENFFSLPMEQKLMETAKGFNQLDDAQKGVAAGILAGGWQVNRMSVLMRELTSETGYYQKSLRALTEDGKDGSAEMRVRKVMMQELNKQLTSDPKKLQQAWQKLRNSMAEIFVPIVPYLLYFMNAIGQIAQKFNELPVPIQKLSVAIGLFLAILGPIIISLGVFALVAASLKTPFAILATVLGAIVKGPFVALGKALTSGTGVMGRFGSMAMRLGAIIKAVFIGNIARAVAVSSAFVTARMSTMAAAVAGRFAIMAAAAKGYAIAHMSTSLLMWPVVLAADAAGWAATRAMMLWNTAANLATLARYWISVRVMAIANMAANLVAIARYWLANRTLTVVNSAANLATLARYWMVVHVRQAVGWLKSNAIDLAGWAKSHIINAAGAMKNAVIWTLSMDLITVKQLLFWAKTHLMTKAGLMGMLKIVGRALAALGAALISPWAIAIAAVLGLMYIFKDQMWAAIDSVVAYFKNLPPGLAAALKPINNLWHRIVDGARAAFNALPGFIQAPLVALVKIVRAAAMKVYELFSYINPFARHSPSLVENVNKGLDAVAGRFSLAANQIRGSVGSMYEQISALKNAAAGLSDANVNAKREEDIGKISRAGIGNVPAQIQSYKAVDGTVATLKRDLASVSIEVLNQERKVSALDRAVKSADEAIEGMNDSLNVMKLRAQAVGDQLDAAKERLDYFKGATIAGMGAAEDATFENEMAQKRLQLQMMKLGEAAGIGTQEASDAYARLQGDIETMSGKQMELRFAGAGSDVLGGYDTIIADLKGQQLEIGVGVNQTGPVAQMNALQTQLEELQRKAEMMDLEKALKFDPLARQIEKVTSNAYEIPFEAIMSGLRTSGAQVDLLTGAYDRANSAVDAQQKAIDSAQKARDELAKTYQAENDALTSLKAVYDGIEQAIRDGEQALSDMISEADTAIRRIEELESAREEAERKAKQAKEKGAGGDETYSPSIQSFMAAAGSDPFPEVGGANTIGRQGGLEDQSAAIAAFDVFGENGVEELLGDVDMLSPFKDGWQKVKDWWSGIVLPLGDPVSKVGDDVGNRIQAAFGADSTGPLSGFVEKLQGLRDVWDKVVTVASGFWDLIFNSLKPAFTEMGESIKEALGPALERIGNVFRENWPAIKAFGEMLWEIVKVVGIIVGVIIGVLAGAVILVVTIVANIVANIVGPIIEFISRVIESVVNLVMGVVGVITGLYNIIVGLFTGDWSRVWEGIKQLGDGIWNIIKGTWQAIVAVFTGAWNLIYGIVAGLVEGVIDFFTTLWDVLVGHSIVPDMIIAIIDWFKSLPGAVFEFVKNMVDGVIGFFADMGSRAWQELVNFKNTILGFFRGAKDWLFDAGKNIIEGLIDGAGTLLGKLGEFFAEKLPKGIIRDGFKKALGIESPAREMIGPGADVVRGVMVGVESQMGGLDSLMSRVAGTVAATEIVAPTVQAAGAALPAAPAAPASAPAAAPVTVGISDEQAAAAMTAFAAFAVQYQTSVAMHTAAVSAQYAAMYASISSQQAMTHATMLSAQGTFGVSYLAATVSMAASIVAQYAAMMAQISAMMGQNTTAWLATIAAFIASFLAQWAALIANLVTQTQGMVNNVSALWQTLAQNLGLTLQNAIKPVFDAFLPMLQTLEGWFRSTVDNIGAIWNEVGPKTAGPARFVINDVYNTGLRTAWNNFNEFLGLKPLPEYTAKFNTGGRVDFHNGGQVHGPGTSLSDSIPARLSRGEHVIPTDEVRAAGGHRAIEAQRAAWKAGRVYEDGPSRELVAAFKNGGPVERGYKYGGAIVGPGFRGGTPQIDSIANIIGKYFPGMTLVSGWRFTDRLNHSKGLAVDASNVGAGVNSSPQLQAMSRFFYQNYKPMLNELIHYPTNGFSGVSMGRDYNFGASTNAAHRDHLHVSSNLPLPAPGTPIIPIMSGMGEGGGGGISMDWGAYIGEAFDQAFKAIKDPKFQGGIGQWVPKSIEKSMTAKDFLVKKSEEMTSFMGTIDDSLGMVERWRPMMKAALIKQGLPEWAENKAIVDRFMKQIWTESKGDPNIAQQIVDMNGTGESAGVGLGQFIPGTWAAYRDPTLPDNRRDPWAMLNAMARYVRAKPNQYMDIGNGIGYDQGGILPPTPGGFGTFFNHTGGPEAVLTSPQWDAVYRAASSTLEAEQVARGFRDAVLSGEYNQATNTAAKQILREFGPAVNELGIDYFDASKLIADTVAEEGNSWRAKFDSVMAGVQQFTSTVSEIYAVGKGIYDKLEEDGVIKEIEESTKEQVDVLQRIAKEVQAGAEINEAMLNEVGHNLAILGQKTFDILAKQDFATFAPIFDKLADLADMLPTAKRSYVSWAGLETDMTIGKSLELGMTTIGNGVKGLYNIVAGVASPLLRNVSGIGGVISKFATENTDAVTAIMAAVATGNPLLALPYLPQILDALFQLIPMVIQAIIDIVPNLIKAIFDFFDAMNPFNVPSYGSLDEAVKASQAASADVQSGKYQYERGANSDWRPTDDGTTEMNFYGGMSFPNVTKPEDADGFVKNLKRM